jgi:DNA-directed RNA polymerase subunit F
MPRPEILNEQPITMSELKEELSKIKERDKELGFNANKTEEYLNQFASLSKAKAEEIKKKLEGLKISRLKPEFIVKITDTLPTSVEQLKVILQGYVVSISQADMKKVIEITKHYSAAESK